MAVNLVQRSSEPVEAVTPGTLIVALIGAIFATAGATVLALSRDRDITLLSAAASVLVIFVLVLSIFGILVLPFIALAIAALARRATGRRGLAMEVLAGPALAVGLATVLVIWVQPPLVECEDQGVVSTSRPWWNSTSASGTSMGSSSGTDISSGALTTPSGRYEYRCDGDRLVHFRQTSS